MKASEIAAPIRAAFGAMTTPLEAGEVSDAFAAALDKVAGPAGARKASATPMERSEDEPAAKAARDPTEPEGQSADGSVALREGLLAMPMHDSAPPQGAVWAQAILSALDAQAASPLQFQQAALPAARASMQPPPGRRPETDQGAPRLRALAEALIAAAGEAIGARAAPAAPTGSFARYQKSGDEDERVWAAANPTVGAGADLARLAGASSPDAPDVLGQPAAQTPSTRELALLKANVVVEGVRTETHFLTGEMSVASQIGAVLETMMAEGAPALAAEARTAPQTPSMTRSATRVVVVDIAPDHLGAVRLNRRISGDVVRLKIDVAAPGAVQQVRNAQPELADILRRAGFQSDEISVVAGAFHKIDATAGASSGSPMSTGAPAGAAPQDLAQGSAFGSERRFSGEGPARARAGSEEGHDEALVHSDESSSRRGRAGRGLVL